MILVFSLFSLCCYILYLLLHCFCVCSWRHTCHYHIKYCCQSEHTCWQKFIQDVENIQGALHISCTLQTETTHAMNAKSLAYLNDFNGINQKHILFLKKSFVFVSCFHHIQEMNSTHSQLKMCNVVVPLEIQVWCLFYTFKWCCFTDFTFSLFRREDFSIQYHKMPLGKTCCKAGRQHPIQLHDLNMCCMKTPLPVANYLPDINS